MNQPQPEVRLIAKSVLLWGPMAEYVRNVGGGEWVDRIEDQNRQDDSQTLVEFMGRLCYRSWSVGLNPNVTKVRENSRIYLENIVTAAHGSVLEHLQFSFIISNVSRVFTHEIVRHRVGTAFSQESMRYVRLTQIPFRHPDWVLANPKLKQEAEELLRASERFQASIATEMDLDSFGLPFAKKKEITSDARRYAPDGVLTSLGFSCNLRELRHLFSLRTSPHAERELREVFDQIACIVVEETPALLADFTRSAEGNWSTDYRA